MEVGNLQQIDSSETPPKTHSLKVTQVSYDELEELANFTQGLVELSETQWAEVENGKPIKSEGAHVCLIMYARNVVDNSMMCGHFPETVGARSKEFVQEDNVSDGYQEYLAMLDRIYELAQKNGPDSVEIYLFGQNIGLENGTKSVTQPLQDQVSEQRGVLVELTKRNVLSVCIHDFRTVGKDQLDDTLYLPEKETLFYSSGQ